MERLELHCSSGVSFVGSVHEAVAAAARKAWEARHRGPGHSPTDSAGALVARNRDAITAVRGWEPSRW